MKIDWQRVCDELDQFGCAVVPGLLAPDACAHYAADYALPQLFRSRVVMERNATVSAAANTSTSPIPRRPRWPHAA